MDTSSETTIESLRELGVIPPATWEYFQRLSLLSSSIDWGYQINRGTILELILPRQEILCHRMFACGFGALPRVRFSLPFGSDNSFKRDPLVPTNNIRSRGVFDLVASQSSDLHTHGVLRWIPMGRI